MNRYLIATALLASTVFAIPSQQKDIVDTAVGAGNFKTLVAAVKAADLVDTLKGEGPFTVFAPTDEAFAKLPKKTLASLLKPENKAQLQSILTYHVVPGKVLASDLLKVGEARTVQGSSAPFSLNVGNAKIIKTDIECSNGVIHVIDAVIMPPKQHTRQGNQPRQVSHTRQAKEVGANPKHMIEKVVAKGSRLYNDGHHCKCASLYSDAMGELSKMDGLHSSARMEIKDTMKRAGNAKNSSSRAWVLRRGLDSLYDLVSR